MRVIAWGTYDLSKPRTRILLDALKQAGNDVVECHADVWSDVLDKSQINGTAAKLKLGWRWARQYAGLFSRYLTMPRADVVFVGYLGQLDVLLLRPLAALRGEKVVWDAFISLHDTVVNDRQMIGSRHLVARALFAWEWLACRAADVVLLDTEAHAQYFRDTFGLNDDRTAAVFVGAEGDAFPAAANRASADDDDDVIVVLFYGQFIPLHGIETIIEAARLSDPRRVRWVLIGKGQEVPKIRAMLDEQPVQNLEWIPWVEYAELGARIASADLCLGIFGSSDKAARVIPNKVFQILSVGKAIITRDSPGIRELLDDADAGVHLVPPMDPQALLDAVERHRALRRGLVEPLHRAIVERFAAAAIAERLRAILERTLTSSALPKAPA
ncbi:MAG: glycosyltransferase [Deltaproteobacteria bacterium]|nr:glycosyltransferase [Deltaproteobacteria bacterium]